jgi:hypothetical protein
MKKMGEIGEIDAFKSKGRGLRRAIYAVDALNDSLSPYFDIVAIFVQSHPEFAGIAWGSIRLIFKVRLFCNGLQHLGDFFVYLND